ncbi:MAG: hypothetical protein V9G20_10790 [Candidatus Promineifilaceae bacterium]
MNLWLCRKAQRQFDVIIRVAPVTAVGRDLITAQFLGAADGLFL